MATTANMTPYPETSEVQPLSRLPVECVHSGARVMQSGRQPVLYMGVVFSVESCVQSPRWGCQVWPSRWGVTCSPPGGVPGVVLWVGSLVQSPRWGAKCGPLGGESRAIPQVGCEAWSSGWGVTCSPPGGVPGVVLWGGVACSPPGGGARCGPLGGCAMIKVLSHKNIVKTF